jgi:hypothetical protein
MANRVLVRQDEQMEKFAGPFDIRVAMASDAGSSVAYLFQPGASRDTRVYLRIKRRRGEILWCEGVINDENYLVNYNEGKHRRKIIAGVPTLALGGWYRHLLGIERETEDPVLAPGGWYRRLLRIEHKSPRPPLAKTSLEIKIYPRPTWAWWRWWGSIRVSQQHPVSTNRIAMNLGLLGAALGVISLVEPLFHI